MSSIARPEILIFGATHVGIRLANRLAERFAGVRLIDQLPAPPQAASGWEYTPGDFAVPAYVDQVKAIFVVTEEDRLNIRIALAVRTACKSVPIIITLVQSQLGKKLVRHLDHFSFISPPELAAERFVNAVYAPRPVPSSEPARVTGEPDVELSNRWRFDPLIARALIAVFVIALVATIYFHYAEELTWIDSIYFVVTLMATVGFGDISLRTSSTLSKFVGILLMIASVTNTAVIFALIADSLVKRRLALSFGRRRVKKSDHILVVGIGSVGLKVIEELLKRGEHVVAVDSKADGRYLPAIHAMGVTAVIGDAKFERTLRDAGLPSAKAVISVTSDDLTNLEIGLNAKLMKPDVRAVLRIYDPVLAQSLRERLDIHFALSMSSIAAGVLAQLIEEESTAVPTASK